MPRVKTGPTPPRQFRLTDADLTQLDQIACYLSLATRRKHTRTDAIRYAVQIVSEKLFPEKSKKN